MKFIDDTKKLDTLLAKYDFASKFSNLDSYRPYFHLVKFERNEEIFQTDFQKNYLLFLISGRVKLCSDLSNGKSVLICFFRSFQVLGDLEFLNMQSTTSSVKAIEPCTFVTLDVNPIRSKLLSDPVFLQFIAKALGDKLTRATHNNAINLSCSLEVRLASYIYQVSSDQIFAENLSHLAELLCTSYRHLLRTLVQFQKDGILERKSNGYMIIDKKKLKDMVSDLYLT